MKWQMKTAAGLRTSINHSDMMSYAIIQSFEYQLQITSALYKGTSASSRQVNILKLLPQSKALLLSGEAAHTVVILITK